MRDAHASFGLDVRLALVMLAVYSASIFFVDTWVGISVFAALFAVACMLLRRSGLSLARLFLIAVPVYVIAAITIICNAFVWDGTGIIFSVAGVVRGLFFAARMALLVWASLAVCLSVDMTELEQGFSSLLAPLRLIRVPVDDVACALSIALRFIPVVFERFVAVRGAQWSRGASFDEGSCIRRTRAYLSVFVPLLVGLFRNADRLSNAMDARCYGVLAVRRCDLHARRLSAVPLTVSVLVCALCIAGGVML